MFPRELGRHVPEHPTRDGYLSLACGSSTKVQRTNTPLAVMPSTLAFTPNRLTMILSCQYLKNTSISSGVIVILPRRKILLLASRGAGRKKCKKGLSHAEKCKARKGSPSACACYVGLAPSAIHKSLSCPIRCVAFAICRHSIRSGYAFALGQSLRESAYSWCPLSGEKSLFAIFGSNRKLGLWQAAVFAGNALFLLLRWCQGARIIILGGQGVGGASVAMPSLLCARMSWLAHPQLDCLESPLILSK